MGLLTGLFQNEYPYTDLHELNLSWVIVQVKNLLDAVKQIDGWIEQHERDYEELKEIYDRLIAGDFPDDLINAFNKWMQDNALDLVGDLVKMVFFGLTDNGYFVAYIPESWDDITFSTTGLDIFLAIQPDYGHLVLSY